MGAGLKKGKAQKTRDARGQITFCFYRVLCLFENGIRIVQCCLLQNRLTNLGKKKIRCFLLP